MRKRSVHALVLFFVAMYLLEDIRNRSFIFFVAMYLLEDIRNRSFNF